MNSYKNLTDSNAKETLENYFSKIHEARITARNPLSLHNRNKKSQTDFPNTNPRYLEGFF